MGIFFKDKMSLRDFMILLLVGTIDPPISDIQRIIAPTCKEYNYNQIEQNSLIENLVSFHQISIYFLTLEKAINGKLKIPLNDISQQFGSALGFVYGQKGYSEDIAISKYQEISDILGDYYEDVFSRPEDEIKKKGLSLFLWIKFGYRVIPTRLSDEQSRGKGLAASHIAKQAYKRMEEAYNLTLGQVKITP